MKPLSQIVITTLLLCWITGCEQKIDRPKDTHFFNLTGPVKSVIHHFNYDNTSIKDTFAQGKLKYEFNSDGMLLNTLEQHIDQVNPEAKPSISSAVYSYDDKGRLLHQVRNYDFDSAQQVKYLYRDEEAHPYASTLISKHDSQMSLLEYNEKGHLVSVKTLSKDSEVISTYQATFNTSNQPESYQSTFRENYTASSTFTYNKNGFTQSEVRDLNGDKSVLTYEYLKTDKKGNWIERKVLSENEDGYVLEKREITYY